ncbi:fungal specific transcription factor domain-containing protein [Paraphaeosphaeria sporulosa]
MACLHCRKSRIRCKVESGFTTCTPCRQSGVTCAFDSRDGRKNRANSKAIANELKDRIRHLEGLLRQSSSEHINEAVNVQEQLQQPQINSPHPSESDSGSQFTLAYDEEPPPYTDTTQPIVWSQTQSQRREQQNRSMLAKLIPHPVKFDMSAGRVRFFGPTTNMHILSRPASDTSRSPGPFWPISTLVQSLSPATHDYLIDLFFDCHNSALHIVHKWAFFDDLKSDGTQFYSNFLHMAMLAGGYRYSDKRREDIKRLAAPKETTDSSIFHTKAKKMAEQELINPGGIPSIQAFFLLADLEVGVGRDDTGWMFAGMSFRLLYDVGLHVDPSELRLTDREVQIRHMVLWACIMNDVRYWALYLGRPTMLKSSDIAPTCLEKDFDRLIESQTRTYAYQKTIETRVYEALLELMDLLEPLCGTPSISKNAKPSDAYLKIATLDRTLNDWYADLPEQLKWTEGTIRTAPSSFFLLHTQYHTALILIHRAFPNQTQNQTPSSHSGFTDLSTLSRNVCVNNAIRISDIISSYRARHPLQRIFATGLQHVGTAATALMAEISMLQNEQDSPQRERLLDCLSGLSEDMKTMSETYQPAKLMASVVGHFIRGPSESSTASSLPPPMQTIDRTLPSRIAPELSKEPAIVPQSLSTYASRESTSALAFPDPPSIFTRGSATPLGIQPRLFDISGGLPSLPSSWFEEMDWEEDNEFLSLMGLKDLQGMSSGVGGGLDAGFELGGGEEG